MAAAKYDLVIEQGATLRRVIVWRDSAGAPIDLTGARVLFQVRANVAASTALIDFDSATLASGMTIGPLDDTGTIDFSVSDELTLALNFQTAAWDLFVESAGGEREKVLEGSVKLLRSVTR